ncbi:hypothetical protein F5141DRAFT_1069207 [Pisolithus sp. B1]|nr:hypothetical protein F5141DRAFT_1069207 [Pisolithus sp. B1]
MLQGSIILSSLSFIHVLFDKVILRWSSPSEAGNCTAYRFTVTVWYACSQYLGSQDEASYDDRHGQSHHPEAHCRGVVHLVSISQKSWWQSMSYNDQSRQLHHPQAHCCGVVHLVSVSLKLGWQVIQAVRHHTMIKAGGQTTHGLTVMVWYAWSQCLGSWGVIEAGDHTTHGLTAVRYCTMILATQSRQSHAHHLTVMAWYTSFSQYFSRLRHLAPMCFPWSLQQQNPTDRWYFHVTDYSALLMTVIKPKAQDNQQGTFPTPSHPWAADGDYNFPGLLTTVDCGNMSQQNTDASDTNSSMPVLPSFHTPGMVAPLCPVVPPLAISQLNPDNTIHDFPDANSNDPLKNLKNRY